jgi:hypothetical protein
LIDIKFFKFFITVLNHCFLDPNKLKRILEDKILKKSGDPFFPEAPAIPNETLHYDFFLVFVFLDEKALVGFLLSFFACQDVLGLASFCH